MSDLRPKLEVVEGGASPAEPVAPPPAPSPAPPRRPRIGTLAWVLAGLLALALVGVGHESRLVEELTARLETAEAELAASQAALEAHRAHLDAVRGAVARLQTLVSQEPAAPAPVAPAVPAPVAPAPR